MYVTPHKRLNPLLPTPGVFTESASEHSEAPKRFSKSRPFAATVLATEGLCNLSSNLDKNTVRVEFDIEGSGLTYLPGDALGIYPSNPAQVCTGCGLQGDIACSFLSCIRARYDLLKWTKLS